MAKFVTIAQNDMHTFLTDRGFTPVEIQGTRELVYGLIVDKNVCLRVYTSVVPNADNAGVSRDNGQDAIRVLLVTKMKDGQVKVIGSDRRVHRVEGWKSNLDARIANWRSQLGESCPLCSAPTVHKKSKRFDFWGCCRFPVCRGSVRVKTENKVLATA